MKLSKILISICLALILSFGIGYGVYVMNLPKQTQEVVQTATASVNKQVQKKLVGFGYNTGGVDGIWGSRSKAALKLYQKSVGLVADGIIGPKTLAKLGLSSTSSGSYNSNDVYLIAKCVHAEARGESYTGQVAVAAVILNRVKSASFPNSIYGVIYQPYAFTAVIDGQMKLEPNQTAYNAARDAMNGWDPSYGSIYYFNPATATSKWIWSRQRVVTIGKHVFAK